jgi:hypothetical protein
MPSYVISTPIVGVDASVPATLIATVTASADGCATLAVPALSLQMPASGASYVTTAVGVNPLPPAVNTYTFVYRSAGGSDGGLAFYIDADGSIHINTAGFPGSTLVTSLPMTIKYAM